MNFGESSGIYEIKSVAGKISTDLFVFLIEL